jgi:hypothetical protein
MQYCPPQQPCYPYPKKVRKRKTKYYDSSDEEEGLGCPPQPCMYPQHPYNPQYPYNPPHHQTPYHYQPHIHGPVHDTYAEEEKKREEEFAPPDYDNNLYDFPDERTIESQYCDSIPVRSIPDDGSHSCHPEVYGHPRTKPHSECDDEEKKECDDEEKKECDDEEKKECDDEEKKECDDETSTICSQEPSVCTVESNTQRDTFILRVPKNKKCKIKTDEPHRHIRNHMHLNAYGQLLPHHPTMQHHGHIGNF